MWPINKIYDITEYKNVDLNNIVYVTEKKNKRGKQIQGQDKHKQCLASKKTKTTTQQIAEIVLIPYEKQKAVW